MKDIRGKRKYYAFLVTITGCFLLAGLAIWQVPEQSPAIIASLTAMGTAIMIPFTMANSAEHKHNKCTETVVVP